MIYLILISGWSFRKVSNMGCKPSIVAPEAAPDRMLFKESFPLAMVS